MSMISFNLNGPYHVGSMRWNGNTRNMEVMDQMGNWQQIYANITETYPLTPDLADLLNWIREERARKARLSELRKKYPTLDQALTHAEVIEALVSSEVPGEASNT